MTLTTIRKSIFPEQDDNWETIAIRELGNAEAVSDLQSWNLHVFMRRVAGKEAHQAQSEILPSDIVFLEPPLPQ